MSQNSMTARISVIVPVLNEAERLQSFLEHLQPFRRQGAEVIVCDGGSTDGTPGIACSGADRVLDAEKGRAVQMNSGAQAASGDILLFLHADTSLPRDVLERIEDSLHSGYGWGRFDVRLSGQGLLFRLIEILMNLRSRWTGIATGDQAIFLTRDFFRSVGGFPEIPLMEDIEMSSRLKRHGPPACPRSRVHVSSRRWEERGVLRTVLLMWTLRACYALGVDPERLARWYR
ncbi:MAG: TIGR04283 family arsenosugar biosynthesis glycosyltransferase [Desulfohalobiaceae bacterium]